MLNALTRLRGLRARLSGTAPVLSPVHSPLVVPTYDVTAFAADIDLASLDVIRWAPVWMTRAERLFLYTLAFCLRPMRYLEIGTLEGGSALIVCAAMDSLHSDGMLVCVDPEPRVSAENWERLKHRTALVKGYSPQALTEARSLAGSPFDLALIDGDHTAAGVERDAAAALPLLAAGGYMLFHDSFYSDVAAGIDRFVGSRGDQLIDLGPMTREVTGEPRENGGVTTWGGLRLVQVRP
jgi:predicted O-methyltransferase YrrM